MNRKNRLQQIEKIAKDVELTKKAQELVDDVNSADDAEVAFNKVLNSLLNNIEVPSLDDF